MAYQGEYDGLCGMYAVANAFTQCGVGNGRRVFRLACRSLKRELTWPRGIWAGTDFDDMKQMIRYCKKHVESARQFKVEYPFQDTPPDSVEAYVERFHDLFKERDPICAIVGTSDHWFVIVKPNNKRRTMEVVDSYALDENRNIYTPTLEQMELDLESLILFKKRA